MARGSGGLATPGAAGASVREPWTTASVKQSGVPGAGVGDPLVALPQPETSNAQATTARLLHLMEPA